MVDSALADSPRLADFTTLRVGGPADHLVVARTESELIEAVREGDERSQPVLIISGGSNILIADEGFPGTVVVVATRGITVSESSEDALLVSVAAGEVTDDLIEHAVEQSWSGLETLSGIPGLMGAAAVQNIGAYGGEISQVIAGVRVYDRLSDEVRTLPVQSCGFAYRTSLFKQSPDRYVVVSVDVLLEASQLSQPIAYAGLARQLGVELGARRPLAEVRQAVIEVRRSKGMILDEADHDTWSAGSFFTNPVIGSDLAAGLPAEAPRFPQDDGQVKTSAAWLIEHAGFPRGYGSGAARLSSRHTLALTNRGGATAWDLISLARTIRDGVRTTYGITLTPEVRLVGLSL